MTRNESNELYKQIALTCKDGQELTASARRLCLTDLFYLIVYVLHRIDCDRDWVYDRIREVEAEPDFHLDLWAREHYKSTIVTYAKTIQDILIDPEVTFGIFSHTRPIAKGFLRQIKREIEGNKTLINLFPDILWDNPSREAPKWSEDDGIIVKRKSNPKESTVEAWGLVDGQPTSKHFKVLLYDDVVTKESVSSPDMIQKVNAAWELSLSLGVEVGKRRYAGTRYHYNDTYRLMMDRGAAIPRIHPATIDGTVNGRPVLMHPDTLAQKRREQGPYTYACHAQGTKVLMWNFTEKPIEDIVNGDVVIGFETKNKRTVMTRTEVLAARVIDGNQLNKYTMESGRKVICTPDHKWWTGRTGNDSHRRYNHLGVNRSDLHGLIRMYVPPPELTNDTELIRCASYLGGIFDGEGGYSGNAIHLHQSEIHHAEVCGEIRRTLMLLGFDWGETQTRKGKIDFYLKGGKQEILRFINWCQPVKINKVFNGLCNTKNGNYRGSDKLIRIEELKKDYVFNIQTGTGNYIANGYGSKNCQMLLDPKADETQGFKEEWLKFWPCNYFHNFNKIILCDPANEKKKGNDYTVFFVLGLGEDMNYYVLDMIRDRLSLTERGNVLFALHREFRPQFVGYEKYGKDSDISYYEERMSRDNYRFGITPLGGQTAKADRIRTLIPIFESGRIFLPDRLLKTNYEKITEDLTQTFIREEYNAFPVAAHDDMLDCLARITDPDCYKEFPVRGAFSASPVQDVAYDPFNYAFRTNGKQQTDYDVFGGR